MSYFSGVASPTAVLRGVSSAVWHGSGASSVVGGVQQMVQNAQPGGTWGGMARGAARATLGTAMLGTLASAPVRGAAASAARLAVTHGATALGVLGGAMSIVGGARTVGQNMRSTGTWGGVAQGAVQMATGAGSLSAMHTTSATLRSAATAVSTAGTFINDFATANHEQAGMTQDTRMLRGGLAAHRAPLEAVSAAVGGPAGEMLRTGSSAVGKLATAASAVHHLSRSDSYFSQASNAVSSAWNRLPSLR